MTTLVVGASGATGRLVVEQLLSNGHKVKAMLRSPQKFPEFENRENLTLISASILNLSEEELSGYVHDCSAVVSCLGHNLTFKGLFGHPRRLVTEATQRLCKAIANSQPEKPVRFVLMNTTANRNRNLNEPISLTHKCIIAVLRVLLPPHVDNEQAADYLRLEIGQNHPVIEWVAVRPDGLIDEEMVSDYEVHASPIRSAIFNPGKTSRINVAQFMVELLTNNTLWGKWKGRMPVIYNTSE